MRNQEAKVPFQQAWGYSGLFFFNFNFNFFLLTRGPRIGWALAWAQPVASTLRSRNICFQSALGCGWDEDRSEGWVEKWRLLLNPGKL